MTPDRFRRLSAAYGADFERWPRAERAAGRTCAAGMPEARRALDDARALDMVLDRAASPRGDDAVDRMVGAVGRRIDALAAGVTVDATEMGAVLGAWRLMQRRPVWPTAGLLAAMMLAGYLGGASGLLPVASAPSPTVASLFLPSPYVLAYNQ